MDGELLFWVFMFGVACGLVVGLFVAMFAAMARRG
jgi:flagellar biosynthesis protein FliQ